MVQKRKRRLNRKVWLSAIALLILIVVLVFALRSPKKVSTIPSTNPVTSTSNSSTSNPPTNSSSQNSSSPSPAQTTKSSSNPPVSTSGSGPITPYGNFVNAHSVGTASSMYSVCNTSAGATCYIQFTNGSLVRKLDVLPTDSNGATYWYWNTSSLSSGSWTVTAVATLNGQTKTANDSLPLEVQ